jgi:hypothetical protein
LKNYTPKSRRTQGRSMKRLLDKRAQNGPTSGPTPLQLHHDDDDADDGGGGDDDDDDDDVDDDDNPF